MFFDSNGGVLNQRAHDTRRYRLTSAVGSFSGFQGILSITTLAS